MFVHQWNDVLRHYNSNALIEYCSDHGTEGMSDWLLRLYTADPASSCLSQFLTQSQ